MKNLPQPDGAEQTTWKTAALFLLTIAVLGICGLVVFPFLPAITGAAVLAVVTQRPHNWWLSRLRNRAAAAAVSVLLVTLSLIAPFLLFMQFLIKNAIAGAQMVQDGRAERGLSMLLDRFPRLAAVVEHSSEFITFGDAVQKIAAFVTAHLAGAVTNSVGAVTQTIVMLFLLFFLYRDGDLALSFLGRLLPLSSMETSALMHRLGETIRASVLGRFLVAVAQGAVASVVFALLGVHAAVSLGLLTAAVGLVPPFGAYIVWIPVALWLAFTGHWVKMMILLAIGSLIISTLDNFLYPVLVGSQLRQHTVAVFLSLLGGIWLFGLPGLVLGPIAFSFAEALLAIWKQRNSGSMDSAKTS